MTIERKILKKFFWLFATGLISYFIINIANAYLARTLGHEAYGDFSLTISLIFSLTPFFAIGITFLVTKHLPIYITDSSNRKKNIFLKWNIKTLQKSLIILSIIIFLVSIILITQLNRDIPCILSQCQKYRHFFEDLFYLRNL